MARIKYKEAAGLEVKRGRPSISQKPSKAELRRLYVKESKSIREVAYQLRLHPDTIHYWLKKYGIKTRSQARRSKLRRFSLSILERKVREKGIRGYARELGVDESTLRHHLNVRRKAESDQCGNCVG